MPADLIDRLKTTLGPAYRLEREIGAGGMATVWLAEDVRHHRRVAVKVLHAELAAIVGSERFLNEIELTAALQHPHILPLFDSGNADGILYYVMPYVDGETLRQRVARDGPLPIHDAVRILRDIADALAHAHRQGIVHRDIKPENVMLSDRHALMMDFGIAKALSEAAGRDTLTKTGMTLGTPTYMSPEQASAEPHIDRRSDIYSFGVVAYEVLTGVPPFKSDTTRGVLMAHVMTAPAPVAARRPDVPPVLAALVQRCLEKEPANRWQTADEIAAELENAARTSAVPARATRRRGVFVVTALAVALGSVVTAAVLWNHAKSSATAYRIGRVTALTTTDGIELDPALSPDGKTLAYVAGAPGRTLIYVRQIAGGRAIRLIEDSVMPNQRWPQWSPDGSRIAFHAGVGEMTYRPVGVSSGGTIYTVAALGGTPRPVIEASRSADTFSASWSPDGSQLAFVRGDTIYAIASTGGAPQPIASTNGAFAPRWSPDGTRVAYAAGNPRFVFGTTHLGNAAPASIWVAQVKDRRVTRVVPDSSLNVSPAWTPDGRAILFVSDRGGRRDVYRLGIRQSGESDGIAQRVTTGIDAHTIDISRDGKRLVYSAYTPNAHLWSLPVPESGPVSAYGGAQLTFDREAIEGIALSHDGRWLAFDSDRSGNFDVWKIPAAGGTPVQLTTDPTGDHVQSWSPNGAELVFHSFRTGNRDVFVMSPDGTSTSRVTVSPVHDSNPVFCGGDNSMIVQSSATGREELFHWSRQQRGQQWAMRRQLTTDGATDPACSPDGRWVASVWNGVLRIVSLAGNEQRVIVSATNRPSPAMPAWALDSRTLYYMAYDNLRRGSIWSVTVEGGVPRQLVTFDDPARPSLRRDFATDGKRLYFAIAQPQSDIYLMELDSR